MSSTTYVFVIYFLVEKGALSRAMRHVFLQHASHLPYLDGLVSFLYLFFLTRNWPIQAQVLLKTRHKSTMSYHKYLNI